MASTAFSAPVLGLTSDKTLVMFDTRRYKDHGSNRRR
jgi:hypothetical protein